MAEIKHRHSELELSNCGYLSGQQVAAPMPRMDLCHNCGHTQVQHIEGKCLFDAGRFVPRDTDYSQFRVQFMSWLGGQQLEEALCNIVYELTRRDR
jgi:hypothetical protein